MNSWPESPASARLNTDTTPAGSILDMVEVAESGGEATVRVLYEDEVRALFGTKSSDSRKRSKSAAAGR